MHLYWCMIKSTNLAMKTTAVDASENDAKRKATKLKSMVVENNCKFVRQLTGMKNLWDLSKMSG